MYVSLYSFEFLLTKNRIHEKAESTSFLALLSHIFYSPAAVNVCYLIFIWLLIVIECCAKCMCCCCSTQCVYHQVFSTLFRNLPHNFFVTLIHQCIFTCAPILNQPLADIIVVIICVWIKYSTFLYIGPLNLLQYTGFVCLPHMQPRQATKHTVSVCLSTLSLFHETFSSEIFYLFPYVE